MSDNMQIESFENKIWDNRIIISHLANDLGRSFCFVFTFFRQMDGLKDRLVDCGYKMVHNSSWL